MKHFPGWLVVLAVAAVAVPTGGPRAASPDDALAGRLGGTPESFAATYGPPVAVNDANGVHYAVPGLGLLAVQFSTPDERRPVARALGITLGSPRAADRPATAPDDADWPLDRARSLALSYLPRDVVPGDETRRADEMGLSCASDALEVAFGSRNPGACRASFIMPTERTVSFITLSLSATTAAATSATPVDRCSGVAIWAQQTGDRLDQAIAILVEVGEMSEDDPAIPDRLDGYAREFAAMSAEQRASAPPPAAAATNERFVAALEGYGTGLALAATGLRTDDPDTAARALTMIEDAQTEMAAATRLLESALVDCGVAPEESSASAAPATAATMAPTVSGGAG